MCYFDFGLTHRLLSPSFIHLCTSLHAQHWGSLMHATKQTGWVGWIAQASVGPILGSCMTHPLSLLPSVLSHPWNKHQTPGKLCTKHDTWNQTWYHLHVRATLFHNYTLKQHVVCLHWRLVVLFLYSQNSYRLFFSYYLTFFSSHLLLNRIHRAWNRILVI